LFIYELFLQHPVITQKLCPAVNHLSTQQWQIRCNCFQTQPILARLNARVGKLWPVNCIWPVKLCILIGPWQHLVPVQ